MLQLAHYVLDSVIAALVVASQLYMYYLIRPHLERIAGHGWAPVARIALAALMAGTLFVAWTNSEGQVAGEATAISRVLSFGAGIWAVGSTGAALLLVTASLLHRKRRRGQGAHGAPIGVPQAGNVAKPDAPSRRTFLAGAVRATAALAPFGVAGYGTLLVRSNFELRESSFPVPGLPSGLEGLRLVVLSDIHFGPYLSLPELDRVIAAANEARPHVALVTGDLITRMGDPLETCLGRLARLRSEAGVFGCMGNHEIYAQCQDLTETHGRALGIEFLRQRRRMLEFGGGRLNLVGVDYQRQQEPYLVGARRLIEPGAINLLLSHNPDVFPVAADMGYDLVVGGHTHGGQVTLEIVEQTVNVARFFTPFVAGLYRRSASSLYVSRGIGTINLPMRLGARPEVALLQLRRV